MTRPTLFIGSSGQQRSLAEALVLVFDEYGFEPLPWWDAFPSSAYTLEALQSAAEQCEFAAFIFAADDKAEKKGRNVVLPRDNVLFECGLFVARIGRPRVLVLEERGVDMPSDLWGVTTKRFGATGASARSSEIRQLLLEVCNDWRKQPPLLRAELRDASVNVDDARLGFARTLTGEQARTLDLVQRLAVYAAHRADPASAVAPDRRPIELDSLQCCVATYCEALARVEQRFWTTTFLDSGFWADDTARAEIDASNAEMISRLALASTRPRRLFLIDLSPADYGDAEKERRIYLRRTRKVNELKQLNTKRSNLRQNISKMLEQGCEVRVVFDKSELYKTLRDKVAFDYWDSELAIYDDFRVDVFGGGRTTVINRVRSYSPMLQNFQQYRDAAVSYFDALWHKGENISDFLKRLDRAEQAANRRIDYQPNWLARYEFRLNKADEELKSSELDKVNGVLKKHLAFREIRRYLDIGTCTGRYPIQLSKVLDSDAEIIGVDDDADCVQFARMNIVENCRGDERIRIEHEDFTEAELTFSCLDGRFDLITCMLGTLSHFGRDRNEQYDDVLQSALRRMADILDDDGVLLIGTWSDAARQTGDMLKIYSDDDCRLLSEWTPEARELNARLQHVGLSGKRSSIDHGLRLDFWVCHKIGRAPALSTVPPVNVDRSSHAGRDSKDAKLLRGANGSRCEPMPNTSRPFLATNVSSSAMTIRSHGHNCFRMRSTLTGAV